MLNLRDPQFSGLASLTAETMARLAHADHVELLRLRYRPGSRAILHVKCHGRSTGPYMDGVFWFFRGNKGERIARRNKRSQFDEHSGALFDSFPHDHRMPCIREFLGHYEQTAPRLIGGRAGASPVLLRYRPGLACTFSCLRDDGQLVFVKLVNGADVAQLAKRNNGLRKSLAASGVSVPQCVGMAPEFSAIAFEAAAGVSLEDLLPKADPLIATHQVMRVVHALHALWDVPVKSTRRLDASALLARARAAGAMIALTLPAARNLANSVESRLQRTVRQLAQRPIHGDMKLEHAFIAPTSVTLIDMDSLSVGDPDYDLAQLDARCQVAEYTGQISPSVADDIRRVIVGTSGPNFDWCRAVAALRVAKFFAQRPGAESSQMACRLLEPFA